jgi:hypothetical protein
MRVSNRLDKVKTGQKARQKQGSTGQNRAKQGLTRIRKHIRAAYLILIATTKPSVFFPTQHGFSRLFDASQRK